MGKLADAMIEIQFTDGRFSRERDGLFLCLKMRPSSESAAYRLLDMLDGEKPFTAACKPITARRSLSANAYCWVLCEKIAVEISTENAPVAKEDVYREAIRRVGAFEIRLVSAAAVEFSCKHWERIGVGWIAEPLGHRTGDDYDEVCFYYGSSTYDRAEMGRLLDDLIEDAEALGIETKSPEEVDRLLSLCQCEDATCAAK